ncbi:MAG: hypothetical protein KAS12_03455 [Candidatus Aenigmarchaeota archaeon]|nr:hypothetical protein [Candidatus Aenigmarchaeota archaeon]
MSEQERDAMVKKTLEAIEGAGIIYITVRGELLGGWIEDLTETRLTFLERTPIPFKGITAIYNAGGYRVF